MTTETGEREASEKTDKTKGRDDKNAEKNKT